VTGWVTRKILLSKYGFSVRRFLLFCLALVAMSCLAALQNP